MIYLTSVNDDTVCRNDGLLEALLQRIARSDKQALAELYTAAKASVYGLALSILKNSHDAEDVLQSCFVTVYNSAASYEPQGKPMAWILTIAKNLCYGKLREGKRTAEAPETLENDLLFSTEMTVDDRLLIEFCLKYLSDEEQQILTLRAVSGFKHREIAKLLGLPLGSVLSKYNRAIKRIRMHLEGGENGDRKGY